MKYFKMTWEFSAISCFFFLCSMSATSAVILTINMSEDGNLKNEFTENSSLEKLNVSSLIRCTNKCLLHSNCVSLFYHSGTYRCILHRHRISQQVGGTVTSSSGWRYYEVDQGTLNTETCQTTAGFTYEQSLDICYMVRPSVALDFDNIKTLCSNLGAELVRIDSTAKQTFFQTELSDEHEDEDVICIQGNNDDGILGGTPGTIYRFDDGTVMSYLNWNTAAGQPDNNNEEHYIIMRKQFGYLWHDIGKNIPVFQCAYICEKR